MSGDFDGLLDPESMTVSFHAEDIDADDVRAMLDWLTQVHQWMKGERIRREGGRRWVFERGDPHAVWMCGSREAERFRLKRGRSRRAWRCDACRTTIEGGEVCMMPVPAARFRFCSRCFENGEARSRRPELKVIRGGAGN